MAFLGPFFLIKGRTLCCTLRLSAFMALLAFLILILSIPSAKGSSEPVIKAAFIYNFTKFASWPQEACNGDYLLIGLMETDPVSKNLELLEGRKSGNKVIKIVKVSDDISSVCLNILYVPDVTILSSEDLNFIRNRHILLVSEGRDSVNKGAVIALYRKQNRIRFDINLKAARNSGIGLSSKLLSLAGSVIR